jgi:hypothetical protein
MFPPMARSRAFSANFERQGEKRHRRPSRETIAKGGYIQANGNLFQLTPTECRTNPKPHIVLPRNEQVGE